MRISHFNSPLSIAPFSKNENVSLRTFLGLSGFFVDSLMLGLCYSDSRWVFADSNLQILEISLVVMPLHSSSTIHCSLRPLRRHRDQLFYCSRSRFRTILEDLRRRITFLKQKASRGARRQYLICRLPLEEIQGRELIRGIL
jgi:hypothetical protein